MTPDHVAVVIPCFNVAREIAAVIGGVGAGVRWIVCVDDASPDDTLDRLKELALREPRLVLVQNEVNRGVGGAMAEGYRKALELGATIVVKLDGDGQMDPRLIPDLIRPILRGEADYTKGNRFHRLEALQKMPGLRIFGNAALTFLAKFSTGYFGMFDPTNGFTAIHRRALSLLDFGKIHKGYFFETDMLFRLNIERAVVAEMPMDAVYGEENSHLSIPRIILTFPLLHARNAAKRIFYNYFLRNFSVASVHLLLGLALLTWGVLFGSAAWYRSLVTGEPATAGTVMLAALPIILGFQLLLSFLNFDMTSPPEVPLQSCEADPSA